VLVQNRYTVRCPMSTAGRGFFALGQQPAIQFGRAGRDPVPGVVLDGVDLSALGQDGAARRIPQQ